ncbi:hypothetical protein MKEN_01431500 [Mycena kentingensis (nom. inval.)]|nr:hypothetical protein MKEN_01431500 [Mycena kentingensis (nom. inval.)]
MTPTTHHHQRADDDAWEDVPDVPVKLEDVDDSPLHSATRSPKTTPSRASPRKRRAKTSALNTPTKRVSRSTRIPTAPAYHGGLFMLKYVVNVLVGALGWFRIPLSFLVFLWMFAYALSLISNTIRSAFAPICWVPGISQSAFCLPTPPSGLHQAPQWADFPRLVDVQSATLEQLLDESTSGSTLALQLKKAEIATADLTTLVRVSDLKSREMLGNSLVAFVNDARGAGRALNRLNAKVAGAVDGVMAVNDYALKTIEGAQSQDPPSLIQRFMPWPFNAHKPDLVVSAFEDSMNYLAATMAKLIIEFELNLNNLNRLEEQLATLHELVSREDKTITSAKSQLLGDLWTKLGGNRGNLRGFEDHLVLLKGLGEYRKQALAHVVGALQTLAQMSEDIENLRERVAAPELVGGRIPVEVHIRSIQNGLQRLNEGRTKAKARENDAAKLILGLEM